METMILGMFAVITLIISICFLCYKKPIWSLIGNIVTLALICWTGYHWKLMLIGSGKDVTDLGLERYPAALILLSILFLTAIILLIVSIIGIKKQTR